MTISIILMYLTTFNAEARIAQAPYVNNIKTYIDKFSGKDTLILFDLDYALLTPKDKVLRYAGEENNYRAKHFKAIFEKFNNKEIEIGKRKMPMADYLISQIMLSSEVEPVSPSMPNLIEKLNSQKFTVVGFTANGSGKYGIIPNEANLHLSRLKSLGYHFKDNDDLLKGDFLKCISRVIFTNKAGKGLVIQAFLKQLNKN